MKTKKRLDLLEMKVNELERIVKQQEEMFPKTAVEFLAERYNYITWMRNRDEISAGRADELRAKFLKEAKEMEEQQLDKAWQDGLVYQTLKAK
jgi:hypothetical protein